MTINQPHQQPIKILSIVEATTINAVAKNVFEFHRAARELAEKFPDFPKIEDSIVTFERTREPTQPPNDFVSAARKHGLDVEIISERGRFDRSAIAALRSVVERQKPDIVVTHSVKSHFLLWRSQVWRRYSWVAFHHGYTTTDLKMRVYNRLDRWSLPHAGRLLTVCNAFARELADNTGVPLQQIVVQHNSVRPVPKPSDADVQSLKAQLGIANDERVVLTVGRLSREKAHCDLVAAFKHLRATHPDLSGKLIIVGDGPERVKLEAVVDAAGLSERVIFTGQTGDVQTFYAAADIFALPSHSEGSPNVLLEAMAANLPIVATAVGGVPEMVKDNETALLVPAGDIEAIAVAINRVLVDEQLALRLTANASRLAAERYSPEAYARSLLEIYSSVSSNRASLPGSPTPSRLV